MGLLTSFGEILCSCVSSYHGHSCLGLKILELLKNWELFSCPHGRGYNTGEIMSVPRVSRGMVLRPFFWHVWAVMTLCVLVPWSRKPQAREGEMLFLLCGFSPPGNGRSCSTALLWIVHVFRGSVPVSCSCACLSLHLPVSWHWLQRFLLEKQSITDTTEVFSDYNPSTSSLSVLPTSNGDSDLCSLPSDCRGMPVFTRCVHILEITCGLVCVVWIVSVSMCLCIGAQLLHSLPFCPFTLLWAFLCYHNLVSLILCAHRISLQSWSITSVSCLRVISSRWVIPAFTMADKHCDAHACIRFLRAFVWQVWSVCSLKSYLGGPHAPNDFLQALFFCQLSCLASPA